MKIRKVTSRIFRSFLHAQNPQWKEFRLIMSDPPMQTDHFQLIKNHLIPYVEEHSIREFFITNYFDQQTDHIKFRLLVDMKKLSKVKKFLDYLESNNKIIRYEEDNYDPVSDARTRIGHAGQAIGISNLPNWIIVGKNQQGNWIYGTGDYERKLRHLATIFGSVVGPCTKAFYEKIDSKPEDIWVMSVFIHLVLNSFTFSGPDPPSEESFIREFSPF